MRRNWTLTVGALLVVIGAAALTGCDPNALLNPNLNQPAQPQAADSPNDSPDVAPEPEPPAEPVREVASAEHIKKGHVEGPKILVAATNARFTLEAKLIFDRIPNEIQKYELTHLDEPPPKTLEELQEKVLTPCGIKLPELPPGDRYVYDPEKKQLMVEQTQR